MKLKYIIPITLVLALFQNCGKPVDISVYNDNGSEGSGPGAVTATITAQSPATVNVNTGAAASLFVTVNLIPTTAVVTYEWYFNDVLIASGNGLNIHNIPAATAINSGAYKAVVKLASNNSVLAESQIMNLNVIAPSTVFSPAIITSGGLNYYLFKLVEDTPQALGLTFCKAKLGATATLVSATQDGANVSTTRWVYHLEPCAMSQYVTSLGNGLCLVNAPSALPPFQPWRIECRQ